ncbi:hypothetical protein PRUPE_8G077400 [Prunus persica]|uniref:Uncharacterized protein n=1 Tax=Prunus persica TaxID=3760 RepID=A0A251MUT4_PRUPE|nr:hypothetical protein PRUPE_8G077400 [Prunus persica]
MGTFKVSLHSLFSDISPIANSSHLICSSWVQPSFQLHFILLLIAGFSSKGFLGFVKKGRKI